MSGLHNIERSGFRTGEYAGYAKGAVYRIRRRAGGGWVANRTVAGMADAGAPFIFGRTLAEVSSKLERAA